MRQNGSDRRCGLSRQTQTYDANANLPDLPDLATALCHGLTRGHPFVDGNKRVGFLAAYAFLALNGLDLEAEEDDVVSMIDSAAVDSVSEADLAKWLEARTQPFG